jgi:hypothetical protein
VGCRNFGRLPQLGFLIFFDKIFLVNLINHNLYGVEISIFFYFFIFLFFWGFFENFSILEVEIGGNGPGILGVKLSFKLDLKSKHTISLEAFVGGRMQLLKKCLFITKMLQN